MLHLCHYTCCIRQYLTIVNSLGSSHMIHQMERVCCQCDFSKYICLPTFLTLCVIFSYRNKKGYNNHHSVCHHWPAFNLCSHGISALQVSSIVLLIHKAKIKQTQSQKALIEFNQDQVYIVWKDNAVIYYRRRKFENDLSLMLWKIAFTDIEFTGRQQGSENALASFVLVE